MFFGASARGLAMTWTGLVIASTADSKRSTCRHAGPPRAHLVPRGPADAEGRLMHRQRLHSAVAAVTYAGPGSCGLDRAGHTIASSRSGVNVGSLLGTGRLESLARRRSLSSWNSNPRSAEFHHSALTRSAGAHSNGESADCCQRWHAASRSGFAGREECLLSCFLAPAPLKLCPGCFLVPAPLKLCPGPCASLAVSWSLRLLSCFLAPAPLKLFPGPCAS